MTPTVSPATPGAVSLGEASRFWFQLARHALWGQLPLLVGLAIAGFLALALLLPLAALAIAGGWGGTLALMARFFTPVSPLSFGGAYAVLPYVAQGAVEHLGWLSAPQMLDGLALGETTPGPLIMVVAFVGFMGGWNQSLSAGLSPWPWRRFPVERPQ